MPSVASLSAASSWSYKSARTCVIPPQLQMMEKIGSEKVFLITVFHVLVPSLDQATDINMVRRLLAGPDQQFHVYSGELFFRLVSTKYLLSEHFHQLGLGHRHGP